MTIDELWELPFEQFNEWRRNNDLLQLFEHFRTTLPEFDEWLKDNQLTIDKILETDQPGKFFYFQNEVIVIKNNEIGFFPYSFEPIYNERSKKIILGDLSEGDYYFFIPYFKWLKDKKKDIFIKMPFNSFRFTLYSNSHPQQSRATINTGFQILKMGGTTIPGWGSFIFRNLDFCDIDFLTIDGEFEMSRGSEVFYATLRNLFVTDSNGSFRTFYSCHFERIEVQNSKLYGFEFYHCDLFQANFRSCRLTDLLLDNCALSLFNFKDTDIINEIQYIPPAESWFSGKEDLYKSIANFYKTLRVVYQANGLRTEASRSYYSERFYELRYIWAESSLWKSLINYSREYHIYTFSRIGYHLKLLVKFFSYAVSYLIWGFGEKLNRIIWSTMTIISFYSIIYYFTDLDKVKGNVVNSIYFSAVTFTTLGFGDITPLNGSNILKLLVASEALLGAFIIGLFVAGFSNKSRY
ncbi:ion channel [Chryseobacterium sp. CKR4-1]|uniref:ion channel n=1 Tax=Chryseobacterium sp. CKR4-1 TaxID=3068896 RepID=UPI002796AEFA|nr:ion channel [Chryseobacterium sp. CKR4-1]MDQ1803099.1 ion channel [Chryseobacterium sp. CKR4-1]